MGRGTKHKTDWKPTTLQTAIDARRLYTHTVKVIDESWQCARACMEEGNSKRILRNMDDFVNNLKGEIYAYKEIHA